MANFQMVEMLGQAGSYINLDLVRFITPHGGGSTVVFDNNHIVVVNIPPGVLAAGLMKRVERN